MAYMKKALVFYLYSNRNAGDMAICVGAIELLRKMGCEITMVSRYGEGEKDYLESRKYIARYYPDVKVVPGPFHFDRASSALAKLKSYALGGLKAVWPFPDKKLCSLIEPTDIVLFNGGNLLRGESREDYMRLMALFYPVLWSHKLGKKVYCLPQSTAGISDQGKRQIRKFLFCCEKVFVRDSISYDKLCVTFPEYRGFCRSTDLAFFLQDFHGDILEAKKDIKSVVAIILRTTGIGDIGLLPQEITEKMLGILKKWVLRNSDISYVVVVQTKNDLQVSERFVEELKNSVDIALYEEHDPITLHEFYKNVQYAITMRLHAGILCMAANRPVVGLFSKQWGLKNPGILGDYDMPFIMVEDVEEYDFSVLVDAIPENATVRLHEQISEKFTSLQSEFNKIK